MFRWECNHKNSQYFQSDAIFPPQFDFSDGSYRAEDTARRPATKMNWPQKNAKDHSAASRNQTHFLNMRKRRQRSDERYKMSLCSLRFLLFKKIPVKMAKFQGIALQRRQGAKRIMPTPVQPTKR
jgi:hypothetical protein